MDASHTPHGKARPRPLRIDSEPIITTTTHSDKTRRLESFTTTPSAVISSQPRLPNLTPIQIPDALPRHITAKGGSKSLPPSPPSTPPSKTPTDPFCKLENDASTPSQPTIDLSQGQVIGSGLWSKVYKLRSAAAAAPKSVYGQLTPPSTPEKTKVPRLPQLIAVKVAVRQDAADVFQEEARILNHLHEQDDVHQHVVPFYGLANDNTALVFEAATAGDLHDLVEQSSTKPVTEALDHFPALAYQLTSALEFLHANNVVHADIKPANILLSPSEQDPTAFTYRFCDFTASFIAEPVQQDLLVVPTESNSPLPVSPTPSRSNSQRQPAGGGTWTSLAPEQLSANPITSAPTFSTDVYSLGILLMTFLLGANPYDGVQKNTNIFLLREAIKMGEPTRFVRDYGADVGGMDSRLEALEASSEGKRALNMIGLGVRKKKEDRISAGAWREKCIALGWGE